MLILFAFLIFIGITKVYPVSQSLLQSFVFLPPSLYTLGTYLKTSRLFESPPVSNISTTMKFAIAVTALASVASAAVMHKRQEDYTQNFEFQSFSAACVADSDECT